MSRLNLFRCGPALALAVATPLLTAPAAANAQGRAPLHPGGLDRVAGSIPYWGTNAWTGSAETGSGTVASTAVAPAGELDSAGAPHPPAPAALLSCVAALVGEIAPTASALRPFGCAPYIYGDCSTGGGDLCVEACRLSGSWVDYIPGGFRILCDYEGCARSGLTETYSLVYRY